MRAEPHNQVGYFFSSFLGCELIIFCRHLLFSKGIYDISSDSEFETGKKRMENLIYNGIEKNKKNLYVFFYIVIKFIKKK